MSVFTGGNLKGTLIPIGAFLAVFAIAYVMADGTVKPTWDITESGIQTHWRWTHHDRYRNGRCGGGCGLRLGQEAH